MIARHPLVLGGPRRGSAGFSLTELLLAMGLFSVIGIALIALMSRASDFLTTGASQSETLDALQTASEAFESDVSTLACCADCDTGMPEVRLYSDHVGCDVDGDGKADARIQRLFFVRAIPHEATARLSRPAGTTVTGKEYANQHGDYEKAKLGKLRATGGLMAVFWTTVPVSKDDPAVMQLYRGYQTPLGAADAPNDTFLPRKAANDPSALPLERGPMSARDIQDEAKPILSGVLYFGVEFWARHTMSWDPQVRPRDGGPSPTWDSTRGILPPGDGLDAFWFSKAKRLMDHTSLDDPNDDTFPRKIRMTVVVEEVGRNARVGRLAQDLPADAKSIELQEAKFIPATDTTRRFVKVGAEWIEITGATGTTLSVVHRGARGTNPDMHRSGDIVHHGRTVIREFGIGTFRDAYSDELPTLTGRAGYGK